MFESMIPSSDCESFYSSAFIRGEEERGGGKPTTIPGLGGIGAL